MNKTYKTWSTPVESPEKTPFSQELIKCSLCGGNTFYKALRCDGFSYVKCAACSLVQINPQPLKDSVHERYGEAHGGDYLEYELKNEMSFLELQLKTLSDASFFNIEEKRFFDKGEKRFLDIGCATGALLKKIKTRGWETFGVEISPQMAEYGRQKRGLEISELPVEKNKYAEKSFSCVHASHLIEHLNDPSAFVKEVFRILTFDGLFIVTTPNIGGLQARLTKERWRSAIYDHLYLFSRKTLPALLYKNGFIIEKIVTWGGIPKGMAHPALKKIADVCAKTFGFGDVMMVKARKPRRS